MNYEDFEPNRLKHLDLIQAIIGRLAGNSFVIKGWAITVAAAFFGFAINSHSRALAIAAVVPILAFWVLDTYYLRAERLFRALYDEVRLKDNRVDPFFLGATGPRFVGRVREGETACPNRAAASWLKSATSLTILLLYLGLLVAAIVIARIAAPDDDARSHHTRSHAQAARMRSAMPSRSDSSS